MQTETIQSEDVRRINDHRNYKAQMFLFERIQSAFGQWRNGAWSPRTMRFCIAAAVAVALWIVIGIPRVITDTGSINLQWLIMSVLSCALIGGVAGGIFGEGAASHEERLDRLLASYRPVSQDAYRTLQQKVLVANALTIDLMQQWIVSERSAIHAAYGQGEQPDLQFLDKKV